MIHVREGKPYLLGVAAVALADDPRARGETVCCGEGVALNGR
jgi:hypothetical protein